MRSHSSTKHDGTGRVAPRAAVVLTGLALAAGMGIAVPAEAAPAEVITAENLPWNADMEWAEPADWQATDLWEGEGPDPTTKCLRAKVEDAFAPTATFQRDYQFEDGSGSERASALIMDFPSNRKADQAYGDLATWATECEATLDEKGFSQLGDADGHRISIPGTEARFTEVNYRAHGDDRDEAFFESIGAVRDGDRIALVSMTVWGLDSNWSYESDESAGLPLHPMYRSMPKVADRLVG